jgi:hypothetical protein
MARAAAARKDRIRHRLGGGEPDCGDGAGVFQDREALAFSFFSTRAMP